VAREVGSIGKIIDLGKHYILQYLELIGMIVTPNFFFRRYYHVLHYIYLGCSVHRVKHFFNIKKCFHVIIILVNLSIEFKIKIISCKQSQNSKFNNLISNYKIKKNQFKKNIWEKTWEPKFTRLTCNMRYEIKIKRKLKGK
jgi:hypothetical protein